MFSRILVPGRRRPWSASLIFCNHWWKEISRKPICRSAFESTLDCSRLPVIRVAADDALLLRRWIKQDPKTVKSGFHLSVLIYACVMVILLWFQWQSVILNPTCIHLIWHQIANKIMNSVYLLLGSFLESLLILGISEDCWKGKT